MSTRQWIASLSVPAVLAGVFLIGWTSPHTVGAFPDNPSAVRRAASTAPGDIDLERSRIYVFVSKSKLGHDHAIEGRLKSGRLRLKDAKRPGEIEFDMASFVADTAGARAYLSFKGETAEGTRQKVTENMHSAAVLDVARYPTAAFKLQSIERIKSEVGTQQRLKGQFTLHGVTRDLTIVATEASEKGFIHLRGQFEILQTDFGIKPYKAALGAVGIADRLTIYGDLWIKGEEAK